MTTSLSLLGQALALVVVTAAALEFIDESACPNGWQSSGSACVRPFLIAKDKEGANVECRAAGGSLVSPSNPSLVADLVDLLQSLYDKGLAETTWLLGSDGDELAVEEDNEFWKTSALRRDAHGAFRIAAVPASAAYPFVCCLSHLARRRLLFQQQLVPQLAARLSGFSPASVYFYPKQPVDFVALPCQADGRPPPKITWYKNEIELVSTIESNSSFLLSGGTLLVPATSALAYTKFHCTASNAYGIVRSPTVLVRAAFVEAFADRRLDVFPLPDGGARLDCNAPAHQPKAPTFAWHIGGSSERLRQSDDRVLVSLDGTLLFSHVLPQDDDSYSCSLSLPQMSAGHYGPYFRLRVPASPPPRDDGFAPRLETGHPQVFPERPLPGDTVYLECFAFGKPTPTYKWSRVDGKPLPDKATILNFDRVLRIENVQLDDQARYKCTAGNAQGVAAGEVSLVLAAAPTVLLPLADRVVSTDSEWSLECLLPSADMTSQVEWFRNGRPLVPLLMPPAERKRFFVDHTTLTVRHTRSADSGVYECIVSNEIGATVSSALVHVVDSPPEFPPLAMPAKIFALKGATLRLPCVYRASPYGAAHWADGGGNQLPSKGRIRDQHGLLVIEHVVHDDEGLFFCVAKNSFGKANAAVTLIVKERREIRAKNGTVVFAPGRNVTCELEFDEEPAKRGSFCSSILGEPDTAAVAKISPPAPLKVNAVNVSRFGVDLYWVIPAQHRETRHNTLRDEGVLVEVRSRDDRRWRPVDRAMVHAASGSLDKTRVDGLLPNEAYQFRVRAVQAGQVGDASAPSDWVRTPPQPPAAAPHSLTWKALDHRTLFVEWDAVEQEHRSGEHLRYRVTWSEEPVDTLSGEEAPSRRQLESDHPAALVRLNASAGCRAIVLEVRAVNDEGIAETATDAVAFVNSRGSMRSVAITGIEALNASHLSLTWSWHGASECEVAFAVQIECSSSGHKVGPLTVAASTTKWLVGELRPATIYGCELTPVDPSGRLGAKVRSKAVKTAEPAPAAAPVIGRLGLAAMPDGHFTTIIEWSAIDLGNSTSDALGYKIFVYISETASDAVVLDMPQKALVDPTQPSARLDGLRLMYKYTVQVAGYNAGGTGPRSEARSLRLGAMPSPFISASSSVALYLTLYCLLCLSSL